MVYLPNLVPNEVAGRALLSGTTLWKGGKAPKLLFLSNQSSLFSTENKKERSNFGVLLCSCFAEIVRYIRCSNPYSLHSSIFGEVFAPPISLDMMSYVGAAVL